MAPPPPGGDVLGPPRRFILPGLFVGALFLTVFLRAPETPSGPQVLVAKGPTMGTTYTVKVVAAEEVSLQRIGLKKVVSGTRRYQCGPVNVSPRFRVVSLQQERFSGAKSLPTHYAS